MSARDEFVRLDLPKEDADAVYITILLRWSGDQEQLVQTFLDNRPFVSFTPYRRSSRQHLLHESAAILDRSERMIGAELLYYLVDEGVSLPPRRLQRRGELISLLMRLNGKDQDLSPIDCRVEFVFDEERTASTEWVFPLPLPTLNVEEFPFDEIRGIRAVKYRTSNDQQVEYSAILDRPRGQGVHLSVMFEGEEGLSRDLPSRIFYRAKEIRDGFRT
jgi:hypothetical protein